MAVLSGFVVAIGCSSEVDTVDGSGGNPSTSSAATTVSVTTGVTSSATSTSQASTSTGMGNDCQQACQHIIDCTGFDACSMGVLDCTDPQAECPGACVKDAACSEIIALAQGNPAPALSACLNDCGGGQGGGGGGSQGCSTCVQANSCLSGCFNDQNCQAWGQCALNCQDPQCFTDCNNMYPQAATAYGAIYDCACTNCMTDCAAQMDPCNQIN